MIRSKALSFNDFDSSWYKHWAKKLKQTDDNRGNFALKANKFWQNAVMIQALEERGALKAGNRGIGFGVGIERLPALFASMDVHVTATDQDFKTSKASAWDNDQLAHGAQSLNAEGICPPKLFKRNVSYKAVDMNKLPKGNEKSYDFLWSNCALGHLGSIDKSLRFIESSLDYLKPGGWAVHTTEANILSNDQTLDNSDTVFFRQKDLLKLFKRLSKKGYRVSALNFNLMKDIDDLDFTLSPEWGTYHSKLLFNGYMATQILLIIQKDPKTNPTRVRLEIAKHTAQYCLNLCHMKFHKLFNRKLAEVIDSNQQARLLSAENYKVTPVTSSIDVSFKSGSDVSVRIPYSNDSTAGLFKLHACFAGTEPIVLATYAPVNRTSIFSTKDWLNKNRPPVNFYADEKPLEYIAPKTSFSLESPLSTKRVKPGSYEEWFCLVKEGGGIIPGSEVKLNIRVN